MHFYITYNDAPSGIYSSQVIDVVKYYNEQLNENVKLISFISVRSFFKNRKKIKVELPSAIVLPMYPKQTNWKRNLFLLNVLCFIYKPHALIGRSVLATQLALMVNKKHNCRKVVYDGRGAIAAEWKEYQVVTDRELLNQIEDLEKEAVLKSDFRIAVSNALIQHWKDNFEYKSEKHVIIPCTINSIFENNNFSDLDCLNARKKLDINQDDVVFIYSGSIAGWQSFSLLKNFISPILEKSSIHKMIFLSKLDENINELKQSYPNQVICRHLEPNDVPSHLVAADFGLLIRENSITNQVASPLKFAEYLSCGLNVIISEKLGDYSDFVERNDCGFFYKNASNHYSLTSYAVKLKNRSLALDTFSKNKFEKEYKEVLK